MIAPFTLYVDEISSDKIKATVSRTGTVAYNLRMMMMDMPFPARDPSKDPSYRDAVAARLGKEINGICITPMGRFVCMLVRHDLESGFLLLNYKGMIILDLIGKADLAGAMAEKLDHIYLQERFMQVYTDIADHPERHNRFRLAVGRA